MKAVLEIELVRPYSQSLDSLLELATIWGCDLIKVSPIKPIGVIAMPEKSFRAIWGQSPRKAECDVPTGTEHFISRLRVRELLR